MLDRQVEILKSLRATPEVLRALVDGVEDTRQRWRPAPGEWAIIEVVGHLADTEERALSRVRRMMAEDDPELEAFDQEALAEERHYLGLDLAGELARLEELRGQHVAVLEGLDAAGWERTGRHGEHGTGLPLAAARQSTYVDLDDVHGRTRCPTGQPRSAPGRVGPRPG